MKVPVYKRQVDMTMETGSRDLTASLNANAMAAPALAIAGVGKQIMSIAGQKYQYDQAQKKIKDDTELNLYLDEAKAEHSNLLVGAANDKNPLTAETDLIKNTESLASKYKNKFSDKNNYIRFVYKLNNLTRKENTQFQLNNVERKQKFIVDTVKTGNQQLMSGVMNRNLSDDDRISNLRDMVDNLEGTKQYLTPSEYTENFDSLKLDIAKNIIRDMMEGLDDPDDAIRNIINNSEILDKDGKSDTILNEIISEIEKTNPDLLITLEDDLKAEATKIKDLEESKKKQEIKEDKIQIGELINKVIIKGGEEEEALKELLTYAGKEDTGFSLNDLEGLKKWLQDGSEEDGQFRKDGKFDITIKGELTKKARDNTLTISDVIQNAPSLDKSSFEKFLGGIISRSDKGTNESHKAFSRAFNYEQFKNSGNERVEALSGNLYNDAVDRLREIELKRIEDNELPLRSRERFNEERIIIKEIKDEFNTEILNTYYEEIKNFIDIGLTVGSTMDKDYLVSRGIVLDMNNKSIQNITSYIESIKNISIPGDTVYQGDINSISLYQKQFEAFLEN